MQVEEDPKKVKGRGFRCFYYGVLLIYVAALSHMVVVSVAMNGTQSAFSTPLVVISLLIPFHVNIKPKHRLFIFVDFFGIIAVALLILAAWMQISHEKTTLDACSLWFSESLMCKMRTSICPNDVPSNFLNECNDALRNLCSEQGRPFCRDNNQIQTFCDPLQTNMSFPFRTC